VLNFNWEAGRNNPWIKTLPLCEDLSIADGKEKNSDTSTRDQLSEDSCTSDDEKLDSSIMLKRPVSCKENIKKREMKSSSKNKRKKYGFDKLDK